MEKFSEVGTGQDGAPKNTTQIHRGVLALKSGCDEGVKLGVSIMHLWKMKLFKNIYNYKNKISFVLILLLSGVQHNQK